MALESNSPVPTKSQDEAVLVLAPTGRDMPLTCAILAQRAGVACEPCVDVADLCNRIQTIGAGAIVIAEEALDPGAARRLMETLAGQLPWSDLPVLILSNSDDVTANGVQLSVLRQRANVTVLDRPLRIVTLVSAVHSALRARRRQYEVRDLLAQTRTAIRQRDQFLAMLGHELRNPLATITNALAVIDAAHPPVDEIESEEREIIQRQTNHLARLVDDLLDVSRITSGKVTLQRKPVDLCESAKRAVKSIEGAIKNQRHTVTLDLGCDPVVVQADPVRIEQVINNLLTNAIKYTPSGGRIGVSVAAKETHAVLRVSDNGMGITPELLPRVFDLFTQAERALDRSQGGLGIGLTLVRTLVEMHDGTVEACSSGQGAGSEFVVTLPLVPTARNLPAHAGNGNGQTKKTNGRHLLVVEDQPDARRALQRLLQIWGHHVDVAEDGPRGVAVALENKPQIALVDVGLPGLDGYEVARQIRAGLGNSIRLVALTGYGQPEDRERAHAAGFDLHLVKPVDRDRLALAIEQPGELPPL